MFTDRLKYNINYKPEQYLPIDSSKIKFTSRINYYVKIDCETK